MATPPLTTPLLPGPKPRRRLPRWLIILGADLGSNELIPAFSGTKDINYHPVFKGGLSKAVWRFYMLRLTRAGRWFLGLTVALLLFGGGVGLEIQAWIPLLYVIAFWAVASVARLFVAPRIRLRARHMDRIAVGELLPVDIEVELDAGRTFPVADLNLLPTNLPPAIDAVPEGGIALGSLLPGQTARVRLGLRCTRRGVYTLKGYRVETDFPFGLLNAYRYIRQDASLLVYPNFTRLTRLTLPTGRRYQPGGVALASQLGDSFEYLGNREYRAGDPLRDIDWRATARMSGAPVVREWREEYFLRVGVILDTHVPQKGVIRDEKAARRAAFERAISICAGVSEYMARQDYLIDLFAAGPNLHHLTAGRSLAYLDQILDILACVEVSESEPLSVIEPEIQGYVARLTTIICIFLTWNEQRRQFVEGLRQNGTGVKVILVPSENAGRDEGFAPDEADMAIIEPERFRLGIEEI